MNFTNHKSQITNFRFLEKRLISLTQSPRANDSNRALEKAWAQKLVQEIVNIKSDSSEKESNLKTKVIGAITLNVANNKIEDTINEGEAREILQAVLDLSILKGDFNNIPQQYKIVCILALQTRLAHLGYMPESVALDGIYGKRTSSAVAQFQKMNTLMKKGAQPDGKAGEFTVTRLIAANVTPLGEIDAVVSGLNYADLTSVVNEPTNTTGRDNNPMSNEKYIPDLIDSLSFYTKADQSLFAEYNKESSNEYKLAFIQKLLLLSKSAPHLNKVSGQIDGGTAVAFSDFRKRNKNDMKNIADIDITDVQTLDTIILAMKKVFNVAG